MTGQLLTSQFLKDLDRRIILEASRVLVVEDARVNLMLLTKMIQDHGVTMIETAVDGNDALEKLESFKPDIIILDMIMPEMDGFEFCERVRANSRFTNVPIIAQTALEEAKEKKEIFAAGATDYITKPVDAVELTARMVVHLERKKLLEDIEKSRFRMLQELEQARSMQESIMPPQEHIEQIRQDYNINISALYQSSSEIGGDFWGVNLIDDHRLAIYITDFSGHGVSAALNTFRLHTLMATPQSYTAEPGEFLKAMNNFLASILRPEQFATMFYGVIDCKTNTLSYSSAAAPPVFIFHGGKGTHDMLDTSGLPLGIRADYEYEVRQAKFNKDDVLMLYSDALIETENSEGDFWNEADLLDFINKIKLSDGDDYAKKIYDKVVDHFYDHYGANIDDDFTLSFYHRKK